MIIRNNPSLNTNQNPSFKKNIVITNGIETFLFNSKKQSCLFEEGYVKIYPMMRGKTKHFKNFPSSGGSKTGQDTVQIHSLAILKAKITATTFTNRLVTALKKGSDKLISLND